MQRISVIRWSTWFSYLKYPNRSLYESEHLLYAAGLGQKALCHESRSSTLKCMLLKHFPIFQFMKRDVDYDCSVRRPFS